MPKIIDIHSGRPTVKKLNILYKTDWRKGDYVTDIDTGERYILTGSCPHDVILLYAIEAKPKHKPKNRQPLKLRIHPLSIKLTFAPFRTPVEHARHMARYGHRDWLVWDDRRGVQQAEKLSQESIKQCLLDSGTQGRYRLIGDDGITYWYDWSIGINIFRQMKRGYR